MTSGFPRDDYTNFVDFSSARVESKLLITFQVFSSGTDIGFHDDISIKDTTFNRKLPTKFIVHGWMHSIESWPHFKTLGAAYEQKGNYNIIYVDWSAASHRIYSISAANSKIIGDYIADFIIAAEFDFDKVHLIGHGLGCHTSGFAAKSVYRQTKKKILRITALDASGPKFEGASADNRLEEHDALMVDAVHTDDHNYGYKAGIGRVNFYVNGGQSQPGCATMSVDPTKKPCNHERSILYFIESFQTNITAYSSSSWEDYLKGKFDKKKTAIFGENLDFKTKGKFYFATNSTPPFLESS